MHVTSANALYTVVVFQCYGLPISAELNRCIFVSRRIQKQASQPVSRLRAIQPASGLAVSQF